MSCHLGLLLESLGSHLGLLLETLSFQLRLSLDSLGFQLRLSLQSLGFQLRLLLESLGFQLRLSHQLLPPPLPLCSRVCVKEHELVPPSHERVLFVLFGALRRGFCRDSRHPVDSAPSPVLVVEHSSLPRSFPS